MSKMNRMKANALTPIFATALMGADSWGNGPVRKRSTKKAPPTDQARKKKRKAAKAARKRNRR